ncbi:unnamed protein product, partial [Musa textilis]
IHALLVDAGTDAMPLLVAYLLNHHHSSGAKAPENIIAALLNLSISIREALMVDGVNVLVDLVVGGSGRARENTTVAQLNLVKSGGDKAMGDVREVDGVEATIRPLASIDCRVSARGKKK